MAPTPISVAQGTKAAPVGYVFAGGTEITLASATARYDGAAAAGPWKPALAFYAPDGTTLLARACDTDTIAVGDDAHVTWFPRLAKAAAAAGGTFRLWWEGAIGDNGTGAIHNIPSGADTALTGNRTTGPQPLDASQPITFDTGSRNTVRFGVNAVANAYLCRLSLLWPDVPADYRYIRAGFALSGSGDIALEGNIPLASRAPKNETNASAFQEVLILAPPFVFTPGDYIDMTLYAFQSSGINRFPLWECDVYSVQP